MQPMHEAVPALHLMDVGGTRQTLALVCLSRLSADFRGYGPVLCSAWACL